MQSLRNKSNITFNILVRQCKNLLILKDFYKKEYYKQNLIKALTRKSYLHKILVTFTDVEINISNICDNITDASQYKPYIVYVNPDININEENVPIIPHIWVLHGGSIIKDFLKNDGGYCRYLNGKFHYNDGPAISIKIQNTIYFAWYQYGKRHRIGHPAVINYYNYKSHSAMDFKILNKEWWTNGEHITTKKLHF